MTQFVFDGRLGCVVNETVASGRVRDGEAGTLPHHFPECLEFSTSSRFEGCDGGTQFR